MIESAKRLPACADRVAIIGGGRWARVLAQELCKVAPSAIAISIHSIHNAEAMAHWVVEKGYGTRIRVSSSWPDVDVGAVIVANAARDHEAAIRWALNRRIPTLVEKPIALTGPAAENLANLADTRNVPLAAAQVFLFARYIANFSRVVAEAGPIKFLVVCWSDPARDDRYGEQKNYDTSLPIFADWLPHIVPITRELVPELCFESQQLQVKKGGAEVQLELTASTTHCIIRMERNAARRQRIVEAHTADQVFRLDFSTEPGIISNRESTTVADSDWEFGKRPVASMLTAFLEYASGGGEDGRLDVRHGVRACQIVDHVASTYYSKLALWLAAKLPVAEATDEALQYALSELLQKDARLSLTELNRRIVSVMTRFRGPNANHWSEMLINARDVAKLLSKFAI